MSTGSGTGAGTEISSGPPSATAASIRPGAGRFVLVATVALLLLAALLVWWLSRGPSGRYAEALDNLPESTLRSSFTDWTAIKEQTDVPDREQAMQPGQVRRFLDRAYDLDLVTGSTQLDVIPGLSEVFGYSLAQADWEAYGQSRDGAVSVLKVEEEVDLDEVGDNLEQAGYNRPDEDDGVWRGSADLVAQFDTPMSTLQIHVVLLADQHLVLTSDSATYLERVREVVRGDAPSLRGVDGVDELIGAAPEATSSQLWSRDFACEDLSMSQADSVDQDEGARLVEQAGGVTPLDGLLLARTSAEQAVVAMWFDSAEDADHDLQPRTDLARGAAPGQGGDFSERFGLTASRVDGRLITMSLRAKTETLLGDLGQGPVLFASC